MDKRIVFALFVLVSFALSGCGQAREVLCPTPAPTPVCPAVPTLAAPTEEAVEPTTEPAVAPTEPAPAGVVILDEGFDYDSQAEFAKVWRIDLDRNYCVPPKPDIPVDLSDVSREIFVNNNGDKMAKVRVNTTGKDGMYINAILHRVLERCEHCTLVVEVTGGVPPRTQSGPSQQDEQLINISVEVCKDGTCRYGEVIYYLNKWVTPDNYEDLGLNQYAGQTYTRFVDVVKDTESVVHLVDLGDDRKFHRFQIQVSVDVAEDYYNIDAAGVDGLWTVIDMPMWPEEKEGEYADVTQLFLETHNMWTDCNVEKNYFAISLWDDVKVTQYPFGQGPH